MTSTIVIPQGFPDAAFDALKAVNKGAIYVLPSTGPSLSVEKLADGTPVLHRSAWLMLLDIAKPLLAAGASLYLTGPLAPFASVLATKGIDAIEKWITGNPTVEKFSVADIEAIPAVADPQT